VQTELELLRAELDEEGSSELDEEGSSELELGARDELLGNAEELLDAKEELLCRTTTMEALLCTGSTLFGGGT